MFPTFLYGTRVTLALQLSVFKYVHYAIKCIIWIKTQETYLTNNIYLQVFLLYLIKLFMSAVIGLYNKQVGQSLHAQNYWRQRRCGDLPTDQRDGNLCTRCISKGCIWSTVHVACDATKHITTAKTESEERSYGDPRHLWLWNISEKQVRNISC